MSYWWDALPRERYWIEIRTVPGIGEEVYSLIRNSAGHLDPHWALVRTLTAGQVIFHYDADESRFVGFSTVAREAREVGGNYRAPLTNFTPIVERIGLERLREVANELYNMRDELLEEYGAPLFLPFQFTADRTQFRMLSNYFTKISTRGVTIIFGEDHLRSWGIDFDVPAKSEIVEERVGGFLKPFRPKADTTYVSSTIARTSPHTRQHETLVNDCAEWLEREGFEVGRNSAIDLAVISPLLIIEAKITRGDWTRAVRDAVSQLYEYRFFQVAAPTAPLAILTDERPPEPWLDYLESDRKIGAIWRTDNGFSLSKLANKVIAR